jgi:aryl-alcohol dehydrogenase-like predicted oxidoreductase
MSVRCVLWSRQGFNGWEFTAWLKGTVKWTLELTSGISRPGKDDFKIALAYVLAQPFPTFPLIGPRSISETASSWSALELQLTVAEVNWLNLES